MSIAQTLLRSRAAAALTAPHGVDRYLEQINPMWAAHEVRARIVSIERETHALDDPAPVATITLQPTSTWRGHRAGQHVQLGVEIGRGVGGARRTTRAFSVSSAESGPGERFTITVRANPEGTVSKHLVHDAMPGEIVHLSQAQGDFTVTPDRGDPVPMRLVMVTGGSGITPALSMVRTLLRQRYPGRVSFVHFAQSPDHQIAADELAAISAADNGVDVHLVHGELFTAERLEALVPDHRSVRAWACGPAAMIELVQEAYDDLTVDGTPADRGGEPLLAVEYFKTPVLDTADAEGTVSFSQSSGAPGAEGENTGATLLEQAEALGLSPQYGCRMGICFSCVATKSSGTVRDVVSGETSAAPDEDIRICISQPVGSCQVQL
ncbi:iron-sulfur cluster-binding domain-containing protein [Nocardioidaceae bacterium]|nr:iron-sulfur cluster-binding domain-containing protein [Nocardioidaceae bacterium]